MSGELPILGDDAAPSNARGPRAFDGGEGGGARGGGDRLPISETFVSIQGEGKLTGVPSLFIRVSGCNLRCTWCDTPYASWSPDGGQRTLDDLVAEARAAAARGTRHAVITGGEPMIFAQTTELTASLAAPIASGGAGMHITIETAGTAIPAGGVTCHLMSISPKLANSTPPHDDPRDPTGAWAARHEQRRINVPVLQRLIDGFPDRQLKFVVREESDAAEIDGLLARLRGWRPEDVLIMPEGTPPGPAARDAAARLCMVRGWRFCHRLHLELFGNVRGT